MFLLSSTKHPRAALSKDISFFAKDSFKDYEGKSSVYFAVFAFMGKLAKPGVEFLSRY